MKIGAECDTVIKVVADFGCISGKSGIWPFFANLAKSGS